MGFGVVESVIRVLVGFVFVMGVSGAVRGGGELRWFRRLMRRGIFVRFFRMC